jgi:hypothetical protein
LAQDLADVCRFAGDLPVRETQWPEAGGDMGLVAFETAALLRSGAVVAQAVGLNDDAELRPEEVDLVAVDPRFRLGNG